MSEAAEKLGADLFRKKDPSVSEVEQQLTSIPRTNILSKIIFSTCMERMTAFRDFGQTIVIEPIQDVFQLLDCFQINHS